MLHVHRALRPTLLRPQLARCSNQAAPGTQAQAAKHVAERVTLREVWTYFKRSIAVKVSVGLVVAAATSPFVIGSTLTRVNEREVRRRLLSGAAVPEPDISPFVEMRVLRTDDEHHLQKQLEAVFGAFVLVQGPHSQGKTTLVQQALRKIDGGRIYVSVPDSGTLPDLAVEVGNVMGYNPNAWYRGPPLQALLYGLGKDLKPQSDNWGLYKTKLIEIAKEYKKAHKRAPILVIDNVNTLAKKDPEALDDLKRFAKDMADQKLVVVVFVTSDGRAPHMLASGNASRMKAIQAADISLDQAKTTLINVIQAAKEPKHNQREQEKHKTLPAQKAAVQVDQAEADREARRIDDFAEQIVCQYTGGRVGLVFQAATELRSIFEGEPQIPLEQARQEVMAKVEANVALSNDARFKTIEAHTLMKALLDKHCKLPKDQQRDIVSNTTLTAAEAEALNGLNDVLVRELCSGNMFWLRDGKGVDEKLVSFQSAYAATIAETRLKTTKPQRSLVDGQRQRTKA